MSQKGRPVLYLREARPQLEDVSLQPRPCIAKRFEVKKLEVPVVDTLATLRRTQTGVQTGLEAVVDSRAVTGWKTGKALIDSGAELNLVSQLFVKKAGWQLRPDAGLPAKAIDGRSIHIYGSLKITIRITDHDDKITQQQDEFMATNL